MSKPRGRPIDEGKRKALLKAARKAFFQKGFSGARTDEIAATAHVTKMTLYKAFGDKQGLFDAVLAQIRDELQGTLDVVVGRDATVRDALFDLGLQLVGRLTQKAFLEMDPVLASQNPEDKRVAKLIYEQGPRRLLNSLADMLRDRQKQGDLVMEDADLAAEHLTALWLGHWTLRRRFGQATPLTAEEIEHTVKSGLDVFLRAYGRDPATH